MATTVRSALLRISGRPRLCVSPKFLSSHDCAALVATCAPDALRAADVNVRVDVTGNSAEIPIRISSLLEKLATRIEQTLGLSNQLRDSLRLRTYTEGEGHPPHIDTHRIAGHELMATAIVCLDAPILGGETVFIDAADGPIQEA